MRKMRVSPEHWKVFMDFAEIHPEILTNQFSESFSRKNSNYLWVEITTKLNSLGFGSKSVREWKKTIADWKCKTKQKKRILQFRPQTGPPYVILTSHEKRLLSIMGIKREIEDETQPCQVTNGEMSSTSRHKIRRKRDDEEDKSSKKIQSETLSVLKSIDKSIANISSDLKRLADAFVVMANRTT